MHPDITRATYHLACMYHRAAFKLQTALRYKGIDIRHGCPKPYNGEPYDPADGVQNMIDGVRCTGHLYTSDLHCDGTVYETRIDNIWFRFVHDMGHMLYGLDFTHEAEATLHLKLWNWLETQPQFHALTAKEQRWAWAVYTADTQGQTEYEQKHGKFPTDQRAFVHAKALEYFYNA